MHNNVSVLIFGAGGRQTLPVCKGFFELGCNVICYCRSRSDTGNLTKYHTRTVFYNDIKIGDEDFNTCGERLIKEQRFDIVVPVGDQGAKFLAERKESLRKYAAIAVNDWEVFQYAIDKLNTMRVCQEQGVPAPKTIITDNPVDEVKSGAISFPVVVKPRTGVGSVGFHIFRSIEKLEAFWENYDNQNGLLLIQEYIEQGENPQYRADFYRDRDGVFRLAMVGKVTRWFPLDGGSGIFAFTIHDEEIEKNCKKLLDAINWRGYANIDMVWDVRSGQAKILEINARPGASIRLDYIAGANISRLILEDELGLPVTDMLKYEDNHRMSCFLPDLLWLLKSKNRFRTKPSWFDRRGVNDAIFTWDDPLPTFGFLVHSITSFRTKMRERKRN